MALSVPLAAKALGLEPTTLYKYLNRGALNAYLRRDRGGHPLLTLNPPGLPPLADHLQVVAQRRRHSLHNRLADPLPPLELLELEPPEGWQL